MNCEFCLTQDKILEGTKIPTKNKSGGNFYEEDYLVFRGSKKTLPSRQHRSAHGLCYVFRKRRLYRSLL
jgi:hypothetical protein